MSKKNPSTKVNKKTVKRVIKEVPKDPEVVMIARNQYRKSPKFPKARTAGR